MERMLILLVLLLAPFGVLIFVWMVLFRHGGGSRGNVPTAEEVRAHIASLNDEAKAELTRLRTHYQSELTPEAFCTLAVATALSIEQGISALQGSIVLSVYLDSLNSVEYVCLIEKLFSISISDDHIERILTFKDVLDHVTSAVTER